MLTPWKSVSKFHSASEPKFDSRILLNDYKFHPDPDCHPAAATLTQISNAVTRLDRYGNHRLLQLDGLLEVTVDEGEFTINGDTVDLGVNLALYAGVLPKDGLLADDGQGLFCKLEDIVSYVSL